MKSSVNTGFFKIKNLRFLVLILFFTTFSAVHAEHESHQEGTSHEAAAHGEKEKFKPGEMILEHVKDNHDWHICDINGHPVSISLPVIIYSNKGFEVFSSSNFNHGHTPYKGYSLKEGKIVSEDPNLKFYDFSITKNAAAMFIVAITLLLVMFTVRGKYKNGNLVPSGIASFVEPIIIFIRDEVAKPSIGEKKYKKFMPFLLTLFFFILVNNLFGLIPFFPGGANVTGNTAVTLTLALFTFGIIIFSANGAYWVHIVNTPGVPWWLKFPVPLMPIVELIGFISKPVVLMIRLFANITAGHIIILGFFALIFIFGDMNQYLGYGVSLFSLLFTLIMSLMELLVAFLQAYVFTLLSALYFGQAIEEHHHDDHH